MNKVYNTVWNESTGMWVVTSELTRKGGRHPRKIRHTALAGLIAGLLLPSTPTLAAAYDNQTLDNTSMSLSTGDSATNTIINSGGMQLVSSGGSATDTTLNNGGGQYVLSGGSATNTLNGGYQSVFSGGSITSTTINSGGTQGVYGSATSTTINSGGRQNVGMGGSATSTTINSGGRQTNFFGGVAENTTINAFGVQDIIKGDATSTTINSGGLQTNVGGVAENTTINAFGVQDIIKGDATSTTINSGGAQLVSSGGRATDTTINNSGAQYVYSGGSATDTTISNGGSQDVSSGGSATDTTINNSGAQYVYSGGSSTSTTINGGGYQNIWSGGVAENTTINGFGVQHIYVSASATSTTINNGGVQNVESGGSATSTTINGGRQTNFGGVAENTTINAFGVQQIYVSASATSTTINSGGTQVVSGGNVTSTIINSGGMQQVYNGVRWDGSTYSGSATSTTINLGGQQNVLSSGTASNTTISGGVQNIANGGSAVKTTINDGGVMSIAAGGTGTGIVQNSGGAIKTNTSAALSGSNVNGSFGVAGGSASNMLLENGGILTVLTGHQATDTQVGKGGELQVENGAQLLGTTTIKDDGKLSGNAVTNNGHLYFLNNSAATYTGNLTGTGDLKQEGGHLTLSGNLSQDGGITIQSSGAITMDNLQAMANVITQGASLSLTNGSTLTGRIAGDNTGSGDVTVKNSVWQLAGDSTVGALAMDKGTINFHPSQTTRLTPAFQPLSLTVGSLSGNGTFLMNTDIASHTGDMLNVTGNATGNFVLDIKNTGLEPVSVGMPLQVVHTGGGDAGFTLNGGKVDAGTWEYNLNKENTDWYLTPDATQPVNPGTGNLERHPTKSTDAVLGMATAPAYVFNSELQSLRFRHGDVTANTRSPGGVWGRYMGTDNRIGGASGYTLTQSGMEMGGDKVFELGDNQLAVGAFVSYSDNGVSHNRGGSSTLGSTGGGLYATWFDNDGYYVDGVIKLNRFSNELRTWMSDGTAVKSDYSQNGFGGSLEAGKAFSLNENTWVQPYVRTTAFRGEAKNISLNNGMTARLGATKSIQGEAGVSLGTNLDVAGTTVKPYLTAAVSHEFSDNNKVRINNRYDFTNDISGSTGKYSAGVSAQLTPHTGVWAEANYQKGDNMESPVTGSVGFRINF